MVVSATRPAWAVTPVWRRKPLRLAVPGVVWGDYPQAREPVTRHAPLRRGIGGPRQIAAHARLLMEGDAITPQAAREALVQGRLNGHGYGIALACAARHLHDTIGLRAHPNQLLAAAALLDQRAVELATGEGKTLVAVLTAAVAALAGTSVHVLTVNDYLAHRDARRFAGFFDRLQLQSTFVNGNSEPACRRADWQADVCFATARTVAFDYLRDQSRNDRRQAPLLRGLCFAVVDEADSLLIDEAGLPLVLSEAERSTGRAIDAHRALALARDFVAGADFEPLPESRTVRLLAAGERRVERCANDPQAGWLDARDARDVLVQALTALHGLQRGRHYLVRQGEIVLIEPSTGRVAPGRQFAGELHRMVCAREGVTLVAVTTHRTGLTWPRFFAHYHHLSALSGTLNEVRREIRHLHGMRLLRVAPHRRSRLEKLPTRLFANRDQQFAATVARARSLGRAQRAVLIGTDSVAEARTLARWFARARQPVTVLDAANEAEEAQRIAGAGTAGRITISTQIAGRGTDIVPDGLALAAGGLHVMNLQINRSPRVDRQMIGRAARQGQPGSAEHWIRMDESRLARDRLSPLAALITAPLRHCRLGSTLLWLMQRWWQMEDRSQRASRLRADREQARRLHFSNMGRL